MSSLHITIRPQDKTKKILVELDAERFERLAANLGLFNSEFLESLERAEKDYRAGKFRKIKTLKELR
ncbi:hypothetical protein AMJ49_05290 [Parcubacteria bacterium DG_74_2]|nr:MAG: hypothetical protein AMJ49_05290 [Parcubacteria bacterium DG_74_2]